MRSLLPVIFQNFILPLFIIESKSEDRKQGQEIYLHEILSAVPVMWGYISFL